MHPYETLTTPDGDRVQVDQDLVQLVRAMWALGIRTTTSCQRSCAGWCGKRHRVLYYERVITRHGTVEKVPHVGRCRDRFFLGFETAEDAMELCDMLPRRSELLRAANPESSNGDVSHPWKWGVYPRWTGRQTMLAHIVVIPRLHLDDLTRTITRRARNLL